MKLPMDLLFEFIDRPFSFFRTLLDVAYSPLTHLPFHSFSQLWQLFHFNKELEHAKRSYPSLLLGDDFVKGEPSDS
jgi:hypothetical protein